MVDLFGIIFSLFIAIVTVACVAVHVYLLYIHHKYSHLPSPKGAGFYTGHAAIVSANQKTGYFEDLLLKWSNECGPVFVIWLVYQPRVIAAHPEVIKQLAAGKHAKPRMEPLIVLWKRQRCIGDGLFTVQQYSDWKDRRRAYDPSFSMNFLYGLIPQYNEMVWKYLVDGLKRVADGKTIVDMQDVFSKVALQIISQVAFSMNVTEDEYIRSICNSDQDLLSIIEDITEGMTVQTFNPLLPYIKPFGGYQYTDAAAKLREIGCYCIQKRIKLIENKEECPRDILTQIITLSQNDNIGLGLEDLVDDFLTFYIAGHETTSNTNCFTLVEMLQTPDLLHRCQSEVDEVMDGSSYILNKDQLEKLDLLQAVMNESMRLHPTAAETFKIITKDIVTNDYRIPKGTEVWSSAYISHRNPEHFDNPLQFDPSRFEPGQKRPSPYVYFPFGVGHRACIGRIFATIASKVTFALLLKNFNLSLTDGYEMKKYFRGTSKSSHVTCYVTTRK